LTNYKSNFADIFTDDSNVSVINVSCP